MTELKFIMSYYHMSRCKARRILHHLRRGYTFGDKPGEGTNVGCGLINQSVTLNYKEFMEGGTNADQDVHSLS